MKMSSPSMPKALSQHKSFPCTSWLILNGIKRRQKGRPGLKTGRSIRYSLNSLNSPQSYKKASSAVLRFSTDLHRLSTSYPCAWTSCPVPFIQNTREWKAAYEWPLPETRWTEFYLHKDGLLSEHEIFPDEMASTFKDTPEGHNSLTFVTPPPWWRIRKCAAPWCSTCMP